jgi:hypothetical protein
MKGKEVDARGGRREMLRIIEERRREGERRRGSMDGRTLSPTGGGGGHGGRSRSPPRIGDENDPRRSADFNAAAAGRNSGERAGLVVGGQGKGQGQRRSESSRR